MIKLKILLVSAFLLCAVSLFAQTTGHTVNLSWTAGADDTGFKIYRTTGVCPTNITSTTGFTLLATLTTATPTTYTDTGIVAGVYCYTVTGTAGGAESIPTTPVN